MEKDQDNITYLSDVERVYSEQGKDFHREKYLPKLNRIKKFLSQEAKTALDVGIGYGSFMLSTEKELALIPHGMDPYPESIKIAQRYTSGEIKSGRIEDEAWPFEKKFDFISCLDVVEHLEKPSLFYSQAKNYLNNEGIILMTTPLRLFPYEMRKWPLIGIKDMNTTHINVHPPAYWDKLALENGFDILESWRGEHLTHVRYISGVLRRLSEFLNFNPKTTPVISAFQQAYNQILKVKS